MSIAIATKKKRRKVFLFFDVSNRPHRESGSDGQISPLNSMVGDVNGEGYWGFLSETVLSICGDD
jgi:hypothetical protein